MPDLNDMNRLPLADIPEQDLEQIKGLEQKLGNKYFLIAFDRGSAKT